jgi:ABC-type polysaccharide/polyol phosphate transport system ATPase subunit
MARIEAQAAAVEFPLYQGNRSLKRLILSRGNLRRDATQRIIVRALDHVTFTINDGDRVALIGRNGAGKTTMLRLLAGIFEPSSGTIDVTGKVATLLDTTLGLDPESTGRENIILRGIYLGVKPRDMRGYADEIADFAELGSYIDMPVRTYSSGMMLRLAFAATTCIRTEVLLMDEWLATGDLHFMHKAEARLENYITASRIMVFASHSLTLVEKWCHRAFWLDHGRIVADGPVADIVAQYRKAST